MAFEINWIYTSYKCKPLIAEYDIECYKCFKRLENGLLLPLYYKKTLYFEIGKLYKNEIVKPEKLIQFHGNDLIIENELIDNTMFLGLMHKRLLVRRSDLIEVKCIIPKGTPYYKGHDNICGLHGYLSTKIKLIEKV